MEKISLSTMPISTNRLYLGKKVLAPIARRNKRAIAWEANEQFRRAPYHKPVRVDILMLWPDGCKRDVDNIKGLLDALTGIVYADDSLIHELRLRKGVDPIRPRCDIKVYEIKQKTK